MSNAKSDAAAAVPRRSASAHGARRRRAIERAARWVISAGGIAIIASILGILVFILVEVLPLGYAARVNVERRIALPAAPPVLAVLVDEHRADAATLDRDGHIRVLGLDDGRVIAESDLLAAIAPGGAPRPQLVAAAHPPESSAFAAATSDGRVILKRFVFDVTFAGSRRVVTPDGSPPVVLAVDPQQRPLGPFAAQLDDGGSAVAAAVVDGRLAVVQRTAETNEMTGETTATLGRFEVPLPRAVTALVVDPAQKNLYAGTADGELLWWPLLPGQLGDVRATRAGAPVTALGLLIGARSLVVGQQNGELSVWSAVNAGARLERIHHLEGQDAPIRLIAASSRDKGFLAASAHQLGLYHSTSEATRWTGPAPVAEPGALVYAPKADGAVIAGARAVANLAVRNPHPEVTLRTLFGKVWYEGYDEPKYVWQSTGGSDDFEPKLSLVPLVAGTMKGTFYSLLLAIPLGVLGAMYTSQFMHPRYKQTIKPAIEMMASLPSVVLGFLAGLWLAPRVERAIPALVLMALVLPAVVLLAGWLWQRLPRALRGRLWAGTEALLFVFVLAGGMELCFALSPSFERALFGGNFQSWALRVLGLGYDQRNAVVVGLAMGFAVIPIIFAIAEDAFSNVPPALVAGSLALGANRWQTVTRVVLPTASPGIFSAIMIGFGRAVGETMIVLMATGNTPIMSWNPFDGFRTLSANIAVEIPEAPHGGTLYRTLFLAALLLFIMTFVVNTVAELVRQRLRDKYSKL